jgi:hypothetical protein
MQFDMQPVQFTPPNPTSAARRILEQIDDLRRELQARCSMQRPAPGCIVRAYHELLERHYQMLDRLDREPPQRSINVP